MRYTATLLTLCLAMGLVTSHLQGLRREDRLSGQFAPGGPFDEAMWLGQNGLMGFPSDIRDFIPRPQWNGFQRWSQPRDWQNSAWNDNFNPQMTNNGDPWQIYQQLNPGVNSVVESTSLNAGTSPLVPSRAQVNGMNPSGPWSVLERNSQRFPIIPNRFNPRGSFVGPNTMARNRLMNNQFTGIGFQANGGPFSPNNGLRNDPFSPNNGLINDPFSPNNGLRNDPFSPNNGLVNDPFSSNAGMRSDQFSSNVGLGNNQFSSNVGLGNNQFSPNVGLGSNQFSSNVGLGNKQFSPNVGLTQTGFSG